jgi:hypothetical protein
MLCGGCRRLEEREIVVQSRQRLFGERQQMIGDTGLAMRGRA